MKEYKKYIENNNLQDATHIEVSVSYSKGGLSYITGKTSPRGYYISVTPVTKNDDMVSFILFTGYRQLLFEADRYSAKQFEVAVEMSGSIEAEMVAAVVEKYKVS